MYKTDELVKKLRRISELYDRKTLLEKTKVVGKDYYIEKKSGRPFLKQEPTKPYKPVEIAPPKEIAKYTEREMEEEKDRIETKYQQIKVKSLLAMLGGVAVLSCCCLLVAQVILLVLVGIIGIVIIVKSVKTFRSIDNKIEAELKANQEKFEKYNRYTKALKNYETYLRDCEVYKQKLAEYEKDLALVKEENDKIIANNNELRKKAEDEYYALDIDSELMQVNAEFESYKDDFPIHYINNIYDIIRILENERATDLQSAINVFASYHI